MHLTQQEKAQGRLSDQNLEHAVQILRDQGFVIIEEALPNAWVSDMRKIFAEHLAAGPEGQAADTPDRRGHGGFAPPVALPFIDPLIIENTMVLQILERVLGDLFFGVLPYGCNTSFPGSSDQNVHRDCGHLFPESSVVLPPLLMVVNMALDDFTAGNGATQIWPGSHLWVDGDRNETATLRIPSERASENLCLQTIMPAGSIVVRDMRTWHRGMANTTNDLRTMLSLVYFRQYFLPDNLSAPMEAVSDEDWNQLSDRAKWLYRLAR